MRVWLGVLVLAVVVTGGVSVYLVETTPVATGGASGSPAPSADEPAPGTSESGGFPLRPTGLEPTIPPSGATGAAGNATAPVPNVTASPAAPAASPSNATAPATNATSPSNATAPPPEPAPSGPAPSGGGAAPAPAPSDGGASEPPPPEPEPAPTPRWWNWTHDFGVPGSPTAFLVPTGLRELEFKVTFSAKGGGLLASTPVTADLAGPDGTVKIPCTSPTVLVGQHVCGPFRTTAHPGKWEVVYGGGTSPVVGTLSLRELP